MVRPENRDAPRRSCLGCGEVRGKEDLFRFVLAPDHQLVPDLKGKLPGRGAYTCMSVPCLKEALKKKKFSRSFRGEVAAGDPEAFVARVGDLLAERIGSYLALANKAGKVVSGSDQVAEALRKQKAAILFVADDISADSGAKFTALAGRGGVDIVDLFHRERIGGWLGKEFRTVAAVEEGGFAASIRSELRKYRNFFNGGMHQNE